MCFKLSKDIAFLSVPTIALTTFLFSNITFAQEIKQNHVLLQMKPQMCVALTQGRTCYAQVTIEWSASYTGNFCIAKQNTDGIPQKIQCWTQSKGDSVSFEFESNESLTYQLTTNGNETLAETTLNVSWVHENSPRKRRWRLF